jgi:hypothetical protein
MSDSGEDSYFSRTSYPSFLNSTSDNEPLPPPIVELCPDADLTLLVGEGPIH